MADKTRFVLDINDWKPEKTDTLSEETFTQFVLHHDKDRKNVFKNSGSASYYYFLGQNARLKADYTTYEYKPRFKRHHYLCHAYWTQGHSPKYTDGFMNIFPNNLRPEINQRFYDFLFHSEDSPWKEALKSCVILRDKEQNGFPYGLLWTDVKGCDIRLFTSLLIATRLCSGWALDIIWCRLVDMGFTPREAVCLIPLFSWDGQTLTVGTEPVSKFRDKAFETDTLTHTGPWSSDQPFGYKLDNEHRWNMFDPRRVVEANPQYPEGLKYSDTTSPNPCNYLWNSEGRLWKGILNGNHKFCRMVKSGEADTGLIADMSFAIRKGIAIDWSKDF